MLIWGFSLYGFIKYIFYFLISYYYLIQSLLICPILLKSCTIFDDFFVIYWLILLTNFFHLALIYVFLTHHSFSFHSSYLANLYYGNAPTLSPRIFCLLYFHFIWDRIQFQRCTYYSYVDDIHLLISTHTLLLFPHFLF